MERIQVSYICQSDSLFCFLTLSTVLGGADDGIEEIVTGGMILKSLQTRTGIKFVVTAEPATANMDSVLLQIYELYADCVLKDPFYELEMPIRSELFVQGVDNVMEKVHSNSLGSSSKHR